MNMVKVWTYGTVISFSPPVVCHNLEISASCSKSRGGSRRARLAVTRFSNFLYPKTDFCQSTTSQSAPLGHYQVFACPSLASVACFSAALSLCARSESDRYGTQLIKQRCSPATSPAACSLLSQELPLTQLGLRCSSLSSQDLA
ncbi:hypothetical protein R3I93_012565 [Phoxinus phoxinus]|uniref:Uncharacterized protein n=1 Tax=Phoxinus phoxinus TaxID=58324 RepID=A0AAN9H1T7_9TELE